MFPDETEIRALLKERTPRTGAEVWPALRGRLRAEPARRPVLRWAAAAALLAGLAISYRWRSRPLPQAPRPEFRVSNVQSLGRPAEAVVLCPDARTVVVVVN